MAKWPDLVNLSRASEDAQTEVLLDRGEPRCFDVQITSLRDRRGRFAGQFIDLRDITERHLATTGLERANRTRSSAHRGVEAVLADDVTIAMVEKRRYSWEKTCGR